MSSISYIMSRNHKNLVILLTAKRKEAELTQASLAEAVQVSRKSINAIENGVYACQVTNRRMIEVIFLVP